MGAITFDMTMIIHNKPQFHKPYYYTCPLMEINCGLRGGPRKPLWRSRILSKEAIQAVQSLKLAKSSSSKLEQVFSNTFTRLLMSDLLDALAELQRQNHFHLALKVFEFVRKEGWYKPDLSLYCAMIKMCGKQKRTEMAEVFFSELRKEGLKPDTRAYTEMIGVYLQMGMTEKAMSMYELLKASGCDPDKLTFTILIRNLEIAGEEELAASVKRDTVQYVDYPEKFLEQVARQYPKRRSLNIV